MGAGAYQRGNQLIRMEIEAENASTKIYRDEITTLQNKLDLLQQRYEYQKTYIDNIERQNQRLKTIVIGRRMQARKFKRDLHYAFEQMKSWMQRFIYKERSHRKLSAIVKIALNSDEYQYAHEQAVEMYPQLFSSIEEEND